MKCPHCLTAFHDNKHGQPLGEDATSDWTLVTRTCPECRRFIFTLAERYERYVVGGSNFYHYSRERLCYPRGISRAPLPAEVPAEFANDYLEACATLSDSPKASAALSRRCLQHVLRDRLGANRQNLAGEIQQVLDAGHLPTQLLESLDAVRNIGNFAAHPIKSTSSGEVLDVEPGEAEWNLDVLESLFDYIFVQPAVLQRKRDALNAKLKDAGKPVVR